MNQEKINFIIKKGVLGWGILTAMIWTGMMTVVDLAQGRCSLRSFTIQLIVACIIFSILGILWGIFAWNSKKK